MRKKQPPRLPPTTPEDDFEEARALAAGAIKALDAGGHERTAAEMFRRAAELTSRASWAVTKDEAYAPEVEIVAALERLAEVA